MARFYSLFSGSKGNASLITANGKGLLIDAGVSCRQLCGSLAKRDFDLSQLEGIFITHTHTDHIQGLRVLCKKLNTKVYGSPDTMETLLRNGHITETQAGGTIPEKGLALHDFVVEAFPTEHDAQGSCGYRITTSDERKCAVCTDLGIVTDTVHTALSGCDLVLLESNYDANMLRNGPYPAYLKARIAGKQGHLSNKECADEAVRLVREGTTRLVLGHLSQENNLPRLAENAVQTQLLTEGGCQRDKDYLLYVAEQTGIKDTVIF